MPDRRRPTRQREKRDPREREMGKHGTATMEEKESDWGSGWEEEPEELSKLSKEELYRKAKEAGIPGRSKMTKSELIAKLRHAS